MVSKRSKNARKSKIIPFGNGKEVKIVVTGGHVTPALAALEVIYKRGFQICWIGEKWAVQGQRAKTLEYHIIPSLGVPFLTIVSAKFNRRARFASLLLSWKLIVGFVQSLGILVKIRPHAVLSFGSYVSVPVALAAKLLGIPVVLHEQTAAAGLANKIVAKVSDRVAISFEASKKHFPFGKTFLTGNPIRKSVLKIKHRSRIPLQKPVLYVTGGSRGAQVINNAVVGILPELLGLFKIYHQTGEVDYEKMVGIKSSLNLQLQRDYEVSGVYAPDKVDEIFSKADLIISRAGANTVLEIAAVGVPAILIPIPWVGANEQEKNAKVLSEVTGAVVIQQESLTGELLLKTVRDILSDLPSYKERALRGRVLVKEDAAERLVDLVVEVIGR
ncbi:MAG: UDP-N-acetylglucosamine--N-acetylmuramyl-(pentapeptide) pyrophosphoryl-undecaprenol N-acetylglucosamine transferase [Candidatus Blackburnbacteria bacterium]|nr:UDP-N-acetylglucosamine--N-acetylmuramyl-(pentapeptide) pyrophosphoryl-undecaprenol N-acetylglucosamine transferase [Candidatus Blackburnbacteria bacterium]